MVCIMDPPIDETCQRIGKHLGELRLQLVVVSGGDSEVPGMMPRLRTMLKEKNIVSADEQVIHLAGQSSPLLQERCDPWSPLLDQPFPVGQGPVCSSDPRSGDAEELYFDCAERIMTEGDLVPDGTRTADVYYDIDADVEKFDVRPIVFCIPNEGSPRVYVGALRLEFFIGMQAGEHCVAENRCPASPNDETGDNDFMLANENLRLVATIQRSNLGTPILEISERRSPSASDRTQTSTAGNLSQKRSFSEFQERHEDTSEMTQHTPSPQLLFHDVRQIEYVQQHQSRTSPSRLPSPHIPQIPSSHYQQHHYRLHPTNLVPNLPPLQFSRLHGLQSTGNATAMAENQLDLRNQIERAGENVVTTNSAWFARCHL
ncbi:hypothetical protein DL95DRAFT_528834 [Leptodontidium sp. 2 PMI_412]|nr:hypothetical protein DL95DRAFT_528834 [Leptodontidium sp. 2 PMI_412]